MGFTRVLRDISVGIRGFGRFQAIAGKFKHISKGRPRVSRGFLGKL